MFKYIDFKYLIVSSLIFLIILPTITLNKFIIFILLVLISKILTILQYLLLKPDLYGENLPEWLDSRVKQLYITKKNNISKYINDDNKTSSYILAHILGSNIQKITFDQIKLIFDKEKEKFDNIDLIIGIETGGAIIANAININRKKIIPIEYINIKARSGNSTFNKFIYAIFPSLTKAKIINNTIINNKSLLEYDGKNILLIDDSIYSGKTILLAYDHIKNIIPNSNIFIYTLYNYNKNINCLSYQNCDKIKMNWRWGYECD
jgi:hypoxanthine phosphoribosyltransferase